MTREQPASEPNKKIWTGARVALAALTFLLLAVALSASCNPTDSSRTGSRNDPPPAPTAAANTAAPRQMTQQPPAPAQPTPSALPDEMLNAGMTALDGKALRLSDYKGKVVILNLWATWCGPCRKEIPDFIKIQEDYKGRGVEVLGLTSEDERNTAEMVREFVKEFEINYKVAFVDEMGWASFLAPRNSIPQTYILDQNGQLLQRFVGYSPQVAVMARSIADKALNGAANGGSKDVSAK